MARWAERPGADNRICVYVADPDAHIAALKQAGVRFRADIHRRLRWDKFRSKTDDNPSARHGAPRTEQQYR